LGCVPKFQKGKGVWEKMDIFLGEMIGTAVLILFGGGVVAGVTLSKTKAYQGGWVVVTLAWGLAVTMGIYAGSSLSGAHLNPAVTLGFAAAGDLEWSKVPEYLIGQMIGAFIGATLVFFHYFPHFRATSDPTVKLGVFSTIPAIRHPFSNLLSEIIGTFILVFGLYFIGIHEFTEGLNPIVVGLLIIVIGMALGGTTGYAINPARDLGPRLAHAILPIPGKGSSDWGYSWVPVAGPIIGGVLGSLTFKALFHQEYTFAFWITAAVFVLAVILAFATKERISAEKDEVSS